MSLEQSPLQRARSLVKQSENQPNVLERKAILTELIELYEDIVEHEELAQKIRQSFLIGLMNEPQVFAEERFSNFLARYLQAGDLDRFQWQEPGQVVSLYESLYGFQFPSEVQAEQVKAHAQNMLRHALQQFEQQGNFEKMFQLLHFAPTSASLVEEAELFRLRSRAYFYEMRRMKRNRRILYAYLGLYVILVTIIFPFLFINAENGAIQAQIEKTAEVDMPEEARQFLSYTDGLYWSIITASSIGYGDIAPVTQVGRIIAATLGVMGVITIGVMAGLILESITPRRLD
jgi:hypothetical protein